MAATIAVLSQKGGTGKTTTVRTLRDVFRQLGLEVLAVDLDPQGNLSDYLDVDPDAEPTIGDVLTGRAKAADAVHDGIIPANLNLAEAELTLGGKMGRELTLRKALAGLVDDYDIVLIDCPPALGLLTVNALVAATHALISAEAQYFAMQGVEQALEVVELARETLNPDLEWLGVAAQHRRHAHGPLARGLREPARALLGQGLPHAGPGLDRLRGVGRAGGVDRRLPPRPRCGLPGDRRRGARAAEAPCRPRAPAADARR